MARDQVIAINDAVHKLQLAMLEGITDQKQLFAAGTLMSQLDYEDVVTERTIAKLCGYPLCRTSLPSEVSRRGKYRISLKEHKVYDLQETRKYCSADCLINSRSFSGTLQEARTFDFDTVKLNEILGLFSVPYGKDSLDVNEDLGLSKLKIHENTGVTGGELSLDSSDVNEDLGLSKLTIHENTEVRGGELSPEQWMGPSNAVEGYVPLDRSNYNSRKDKHDSKAVQNNQEKSKDPPFSEMDFTSTVIISDEFSASKLPPQTEQASPVGKSDDGKGKTVLREQTAVPPTRKISKFRREKEKDRNDGYSVECNLPKQPPCSTEDPLGGQLKGGLETLDKKSSLPGSSSDSKEKSKFSRFCKEGEMEKDIKNFGFDEMGFETCATMSDGYGVEYSVSKQPPCSIEDPLSYGSKNESSRTKPEILGKKIISVEYHGNSSEDGDEILKAESCKGPKAQDVCSTSETVTKSCLKGSKKLKRSVTWADQNNGHGGLCEVRNNGVAAADQKLKRSVTWADQNDGHGGLCEVRNNGVAAGLNPSSTDTEDVNSVSRLALAEACATALSQAAEAVSSGDSDASDAAAKAGIVLLPSTHQFDEEVSEEDMEEEMSEEDEPTLVKWPNKPGIPDSDIFDRDESWFNGAPEGFNLTLSGFAIMWDALFSWVSSSSLAYIYGKDESAHEEFLLVNGKEYPRRIILAAEIKETLAGCLARALPRLATDLRLPIAISELEKGLGSLLETMSMTGAVPSFSVKQWMVIVLLFLEALSVSRIPRIAPYIVNRNKVLEGSGIGSEEYEIMKDILLPLGRVPQFATRCGA